MEILNHTCHFFTAQVEPISQKIPCLVLQSMPVHFYVSWHVDLYLCESIFVPFLPHMVNIVMI